ncbi:alpha-ribazole phosphatase [Dysgonomonas sp. GY617]|uniref:alpha-ribazole phosphatase n=1 Tax=Dysgonomonas sp. GY617 TaxID=2780420 RepID=UPI0018847255|nr:alpha-ribazole phosphatase [Dysgonomonas sp. GY617]MBF0574502.1 alpha-ribazole phosphatase [Dysgonomonas sp. GY617]
MKLYLIRHTSVDVPQGTCYGQSNVPLKSTFEEEAEVVKQKLKGIEFDAVYSSPLSRCRKLARYCGFQDDVQWIDRLKEMYFGEWEMMNWDHIDDENIESWYENWIHQPATGGESFKMLYDRVASLLDEIKKEDYKNVAIFTHGGVINCAKVYTGDSTLENAFDTVPAYGEIVCLNI